MSSEEMRSPTRYIGPEKMDCSVIRVDCCKGTPNGGDDWFESVCGMLFTLIEYFVDLMLDIIERWPKRIEKNAHKD